MPERKSAFQKAEELRSFRDDRFELPSEKEIDLYKQAQDDRLKIKGYDRNTVNGMTYRKSDH